MEVLKIFKKLTQSQLWCEPSALSQHRMNVFTAEYPARKNEDYPRYGPELKGITS